MIRRIWHRIHDLWDMNQELSLERFNMIGEIIWSRQDMIGEVFVLYQSMREFQISSCETGHIGVG
jgi:DNA modification methylase